MIVLIKCFFSHEDCSPIPCLEHVFATMMTQFNWLGGIMTTATLAKTGIISKCKQAVSAANVQFSVENHITFSDLFNVLSFSAHEL